MNILEIKNNLVKLSYSQEENPVLGKFIILANSEKSYVAQFVNLKSDASNNFAIVRLIFTFTSDGVVDNYDGSIPPINSEISPLAETELLELLPVETPIQFGNLSNGNNQLNLDISIFERNFTVFAEKSSNRKIFIANCIKQLFKMKEKSVIVDNCNMFEDYKKIKLGQDYKLPLNSQMIDYIFEYELSEVEASIKAVIQDIFYAVQQYIKTLEDGFLPIDKFIEVVTAQYKETQMPELALLKNKLLKYSDAGIFANTKEEIYALEQNLEAKNCVIVDISEINDTLQRETIKYLHNILNSLKKYIYLFVTLNNENSDKKLINQIINHNHIFTTILTGSAYKYTPELFEQAENIVLFAPILMQNDFAPYNTFLNKLNPDECVICGKLTQGIPFITQVNDIDVGITIDDVLGERFVFTPNTDETDIVEEMPINNIFQDTPPTEISPVSSESRIEQVNNLIEPVDNIFEEDNSDEYDDNGNELMEETTDMFEQKMLNTPTTEHDITPEETTVMPEETETSEQDEEFIDLPPVVPVYPSEEEQNDDTSVEGIDFAQGDSVNHPRYGRGFVEKIIKYGNKTLCSIAFDNVGRRLLDPSISELTKL